ncbi:ion channel [Kitasatospora sp. NBC_01539]|uniref:ion channel n=1 Tax=Kitasatospora sp. NBC_01539 TaxID=2903577 RepID=UPI0038601D7D
MTKFGHYVRGALVLVGGPVLMLVVWFTVPLQVFGPHNPVLSWTVFAGALLALAALLLRQIWAELSGRADRHPVVGISLLMVASMLVFATCYLALARDPGQFAGQLTTRVDALYFTVITMATVGYGDITPSGQEARSMVMLQILYTLVFLTAGATSISRRTRIVIGRRLGHEPPDGPSRTP